MTRSRKRSIRYPLIVVVARPADSSVRSSNPSRRNRSTSPVQASGAYPSHQPVAPARISAATLRNRKVAAEILAGATGWWLGYAPDAWTGLVDRLRRGGFDDRTLLSAGLATTTINGYLIDRFRDRVMFLAEDRQLRPVGFIGRSRNGRVRYLNSPNTAIYNKAETLIGLQALQERLVDRAT